MDKPEHSRRNACTPIHNAALLPAAWQTPDDHSQTKVMCRNSHHDVSPAQSVPGCSCYTTPHVVTTFAGLRRASIQNCIFSETTTAISATLIQIHGSWTGKPSNNSNMKIDVTVHVVMGKQAQRNHDTTRHACVGYLCARRANCNLCVSSFATTDVHR